jgi:hypothetical protein
VLAYTTGFMVGPALAGVGLKLGDGTPWFVVLAVGCAVAAGWSLALRRRLPAGIDRSAREPVEAAAMPA